jgi:hypothetical protein
MSQTADTPFPIFTDIDGQPLENGYVYYGTGGLQADTNPITVYWDKANTIVASQPIRTTSGYPSRSGSPGRVFVPNGDYSIKVSNKNNTTVTENLNAGSDEEISYSTEGGVDRPLNDKLGDFVSVKDFGATGDGVTDDTAAIQLALGSYSDKLTVYFPQGTYIINDRLSVGSFKQLLGDGKYQTILRWSRDDADGSALLLDAFSNVKDMTLENIGSNNTTSICLCSNTPTVGNGAHGCTYEALNITGWGYCLSGSVVNNPEVATSTRSQIFNSLFSHCMFDGNNQVVLAGVGCNNVRFECCNFESNTASNIMVFNTGLGIQLENCTFQNASANIDVSATGCVNMSIKDCYFEPANGLFFDSCGGTAVESCVINTESLSNQTNNAFVRSSIASIGGGLNTDVTTRIADCTTYQPVTGTKYWAFNDSSDVKTFLYMNYARYDDMLSTGTGAVEATFVDGSNSNGNYVKYADGTMICYYSYIVSGYNTTGNKLEAWTFPQVFATTSVQVNYSLVEPSGSDVGRSTLLNMSSTVISADVTARINVTTGYTAFNPRITFSAIGRWKA